MFLIICTKNCIRLRITYFNMDSDFMDLHRNLNKYCMSMLSELQTFFFTFSIDCGKYIIYLVYFIIFCK